MTTRRSWTPTELRAIARRPKVGEIDLDNMRQALLYAADLIEASDAVLEENRRLLAQIKTGAAKEGEKKQ
jgi:hypothetical protein